MSDHMLFWTGAEEQKQSLIQDAYKFIEAVPLPHIPSPQAITYITASPEGPYNT